MHRLIREDSGIENFKELVEKPFIPGGLGSSGEAITLELFESMGILDEIQIKKVSLKEAVDAVKNRKVVGFATSSPPPSPMVVEFSSGTKISLLSLEDEDFAKFKEKNPIFTRFIILLDTYPDIDYPVKNFSNPVGTYAMSDLPEEIAYKITKAFWAFLQL